MPSAISPTERAPLLTEPQVKVYRLRALRVLVSIAGPIRGAGLRASPVVVVPAYQAENSRSGAIPIVANDIGSRSPATAKPIPSRIKCPAGSPLDELRAPPIRTSVRTSRSNAIDPVDSFAVESEAVHSGPGTERNERKAAPNRANAQTAFARVAHPPPRMQSNVCGPTSRHTPGSEQPNAEMMHAAHDGAWLPHASGTTVHVGASVGSPIPPSTGKPPY